MARKARRIRSLNPRDASLAPPLNEQPPQELDFEKGNERSGRVGDLRPSADVREEFPRVRERQAGMTAGETAGGEVTADDLSPETLLDEERSRTPAAQHGRAPADSLLREADEADIGGSDGEDEAEAAQDEPGPGSAGAEDDRFRRRRESIRRGKEPDERESGAAHAGDPEPEADRKP
jgi:hypothetical protein